MGSRAIAKIQLDPARIQPRTATHVHPICASGRDSPEPPSLMLPTTNCVKRADERTGSKSSKTYTLNTVVEETFEKGPSCRCGFTEKKVQTSPGLSQRRTRFIYTYICMHI